MSYLIDFSKFNIGYVAYCGMLDEYQNVTKLDISTFNTSSVTQCMVCFVDVVVWVQ